MYGWCRADAVAMALGMFLWAGRPNQRSSAKATVELRPAVLHEDDATGSSTSPDSRSAPVPAHSALNPWLPQALTAIAFCAGITLVFSAMIASMVPAFAGVPFVTDDADTPDAKHFEINIAAQYTRFGGGSVAGVPSVEVNYGVTSKLQVSVLTALALSHVDDVGTNVGIGDTELGVKYRFIDSDDWGWRPGVAFAPVIIMPSGSQTRGLGEGRIQGFLPIWLSKDFNQWTVFGGGGYNINPGTDRLNWWFSGLGATRELDPKWTIGAEIYYTTATAQGQKSSTGFNVGAIYNINDFHHLMVSVGRNLINARDNNEFSTFIGYQLTF